jgi:hypothetical protein
MRKIKVISFAVLAILTPHHFHGIDSGHLLHHKHRTSCRTIPSAIVVKHITAIFYWRDFMYERSYVCNQRTTGNQIVIHAPSYSMFLPLHL